jgi:hypothetical protein
MSCVHDLANGTCSQCDSYVVQNLRAEISELKKRIENGIVAHNEEKRARDWLALEKSRLEVLLDRAIAALLDVGLITNRLELAFGEKTPSPPSSWAKP